MLNAVKRYNSVRIRKKNTRDYIPFVLRITYSERSVVEQLELELEPVPVSVPVFAASWVDIVALDMVASYGLDAVASYDLDAVPSFGLDTDAFDSVAPMNISLLRHKTVHLPIQFSFLSIPFR